MRIRLQLSAILLILCAPLFSEQRHYTITDLGDGTNQFSVSYAMNNLGDVVGDANFHACFWMHGIIVIPPSLATGFSTARGINNRRQVVGGRVNASGSSVAFVYDNGVVTDFQLPTGTTYSLAAAINNRGDVLLNILNGANGSTVLWTGDGPRQIPSLGGSYISGNGLNQRAQVVGESTPAGANLSHGFLWADGQITDIGVLTGGETGNYSSAIAINDAGRVVGVSSAARQTQHAFVWAQGIMTGLGTLPGDNRSYATAINNRGEIVGWSASVTGIIMGATRAVLWEHDTVYDLGDSIPAGSGWVLDQATAINDRGQIAGIGHRDGLSRAFLLSPVQAEGPTDLQEPQRLRPMRVFEYQVP
jgi:probable HAF family extracellular repeat protein